MPPLSLREALDILNEHGCSPIQPRTSERLPVTEALGRVLAAPVMASFDHPPFDMSLRDGVAVVIPERGVAATEAECLAISADSQDGDGLTVPAGSIFELRGTVFPGQATELQLSSGQAARIMTGAALPAGSIAVVMREDLKWAPVREANGGDQNWSDARTAGWAEAERATHVQLTQPIRAGVNVMPCGTVFRRGQPLAAAGDRLTPLIIGLLASAGVAEVTVTSRLKVAVLITGDELAEVGAERGESQVYNSNGPLLAAELATMPSLEVEVARLADNTDVIESWLQARLDIVDILITTGAVSAGAKDQLPNIFKKLGVETLFHGVQIKPGKPVFFGKKKREPSSQTNAGRETASQTSTLVFGLPGNPISVWVTYQIFVRSILEATCERTRAKRWMKATLEDTVKLNDGRLTFWPGRLRWHAPPWSTGNAEVPDNGPTRPTTYDSPAPVSAADLITSSCDSHAICRVEPLPWKGSPDLVTPTEADVLIYFDPSVSEYHAHDLVSVWLF
jgi:molybdopterin molybdotransferase